MPGESATRGNQMTVNDIESQLFHSTMRVNGVKDGQDYTGTAFIWNEPIGNGRHFPFLVSNRHVLDPDADALTVLGLAKGPTGDPDFGAERRIDLACKGCGSIHIIDHHDQDIDVAVIPVAQQITDGDVYVKGLGPNLLSPSDPSDNGHKPSTIERVSFVGYPNGIYDEHNVLPIFRQGHVATRLDLDYRGKPQFLIDASVFGGSSGSPVFVYRRFQRVQDGSIAFGETPIFAGILAAVHVGEQSGEIEVAKSEFTFKKELGLGLVFRAETLRPVIDHALKHFGIPHLQVPSEP